MPAITSKQLLHEDIRTYRDIYSDAWQKIVKKASDNEKDLPKLRECFTAKDGRLMNYLYLHLPHAKELVANTKTVWIMSTYVAIPIDGQTVFSTVLFGIDELGNPTSGCYLAGVPPLPAIVAEPNYDFEHVSLKYADGIIWAWEIMHLDSLSAAMFTTTKGVLRGYRHDALDFRTLIENDGGDKALWLNFTLYIPTGSTSPMFGTVLSLQQLPAEDRAATMDTSEDQFYDMSKPCPPFCY